MNKDAVAVAVAVEEGKEGRGNNASSAVGGVVLTESISPGGVAAAVYAQAETATGTSSLSSKLSSLRSEVEAGGEKKKKKGRFQFDSLGWIILGASAGTALFGAAQIVAQKWQNLQMVPKCNGCEPEYFVAPFTQAWQMYAGESLCLIPYLFSLWWRSRGKSFGPLDIPHTSESLAKPKCAIWWWTLPALCDLAATGSMNYANTITLASTVTVLRNLMVLINALLALFWLHRSLKVYEYAGVVLVTIGMILTAVYGLIHPETNTSWDSSLSWLGIVLALVGTSIQALQLAVEEKIFRTFRMHPLGAMGWEGTFGMVGCAVLLVILEYTGGEDVSGAIYQTGHNAIIMGSTFLYMICAFLFNGLGLTVTKLATSLLRAILFSLRSIIVWVFELCVGWNEFNGLDLAGQIICLIGVAVFANAFVFPCWPSFNAFFQKPVVIPCIDGKQQSSSETPVSDRRSEVSSVLSEAKSHAESIV